MTKWRIRPVANCGLPTMYELLHPKGYRIRATVGVDAIVFLFRSVGSAMNYARHCERGDDMRGWFETKDAAR